MAEVYVDHAHLAEICAAPYFFEQLFAGQHAPAVFGQDGKQPTADDVKALQTKYLAERDKVLKDGSAKRFLPVLIEKADQMAKRGDLALNGGRLLQAAEASMASGLFRPE